MQHSSALAGGDTSAANAGKAEHDFTSLVADVLGKVVENVNKQSHAGAALDESHAAGAAAGGGASPTEPESRVGSVRKTANEEEIGAVVIRSDTLTLVPPDGMVIPDVATDSDTAIVKYCLNGLSHMPFDDLDKHWISILQRLQDPIPELTNVKMRNFKDSIQHQIKVAFMATKMYKAMVQQITTSIGIEKVDELTMTEEGYTPDAMWRTIEHWQKMETKLKGILSERYAKYKDLAQGVRDFWNEYKRDYVVELTKSIGEEVVKSYGIGLTTDKKILTLARLRDERKEIHGVFPEIVGEEQALHEKLLNKIKECKQNSEDYVNYKHDMQKKEQQMQQKIEQLEQDDRAWEEDNDDLDKQNKVLEATKTRLEAAETDHVAQILAYKKVIDEIKPKLGVDHDNKDGTFMQLGESASRINAAIGVLRGKEQQVENMKALLEVPRVNRDTVNVYELCKGKMAEKQREFEALTRENESNKESVSGLQKVIEGYKADAQMAGAEEKASVKLMDVQD